MMGYEPIEEPDLPEINTEHQMMVAVLMKSGSDVLDSLTPSACNLIHAVMGISGEAGELLDAIKKAAIYRKPINRENVVEELGDLEFYMEALRSELRVSREETLEHNLIKLSKGDKARYKGGYSDRAAIARVDKE